MNKANNIALKIEKSQVTATQFLTVYRENKPDS